MNYNIIVATCNDNGIGSNNALPWNFISEDMKSFSKLTKGKGNNAIIMGANTYKSIGRPLPNRVNIILSNSINEENEEKNIYVFKNIDSCIQFCNDKCFDEVWIIGGESIYTQFLELNYIEKIYKTEINKKIECDTFFPSIPYSFQLFNTSNLSPLIQLNIWVRSKGVPLTNPIVRSKK